MNRIIPAHGSGSGAHPRLVERAFRDWEAGRQAPAAQAKLSPPARAFTVALTREAGTQGTAVAREVGRLLGWHVYDHELLEQIAQDMGLRSNLLESVDERQQGWLREAAEALMSANSQSDWGTPVTESSYVHHLIKTVLALGAHGECVIVGRGAAFFLPTETTVRVRLVGPLPERIATLSLELGIPEREAARKVDIMDRERSEFVRHHFFMDPADPKNYDLVLNASRLSPTQSAQVIVEALRQLEAGSKRNG